MEIMTIDIEPSPQARRIYNMMVVRAEEDDDVMVLTLAHTIELAVTLRRRGEDAMACSAVTELREAAWIAPVSDGGWLIA
jgi:hypothetical protein